MFFDAWLYISVLNHSGCLNRNGADTVSFPEWTASNDSLFCCRVAKRSTHLVFIVRRVQNRLESLIIASVSLRKSRADNGRTGTDFEYCERKWRSLIYSLLCFKGSFLQLHFLLVGLAWCKNLPFPSLTLRQDFSYSCLDQGCKNAVAHSRHAAKNLDCAERDLQLRISA